ncbi:MAG: DNA repair protein RecN [Bacteroidota bacterium]
MLTSLTIKNFALIEDVSIELHKDLSIITGETGAGKSILLGALNLVLGDRAEIKSVRNTDKKCVIEAHFQIANYQLQNLFEENGFDYDDYTIIRREILPSGKSRAFVNDSPVKLQGLQQLGKQLVDIHSQHETLAIGSRSYQYKILDSIADNKNLLEEYRVSLSQLNNLQTELDELKEVQKSSDKAYDYNLFLLEELDKANLKEGEQETLETKLESLSNVELLKENLSAVTQSFQQEELGVLDLLQQAKINFNQIADFNPVYQDISKRIESALIELQDVAVEVDKSLEQVEDDPNLLEEINTKLELIYSLQKKHQVENVQELLQIQEELAEKVLKKQGLGDEIALLEKQIIEQENKVKSVGEKLYKRRKKVSPQLISSVKEILADLGMKDADLKIDLQLSSTQHSFGIEEMNWKFSANKGSDLKDIKKVASGGELSRITLAVKSILAKYSNLPTIIFDEIDTGVSGDIASKIGIILKRMGAEMQVISITHLPQIAAKGKQHYKVFKQTKNTTTTSHLKKLNKEERLVELAEMLGGDANSKSAIVHAKTLFDD